MVPMFRARSVARLAVQATVSRRAALAAVVCVALAACALPKHPDASAPAPDPFNPAATQLLDDTQWELANWKNADGTARDIPQGEGAKPITLDLSTATGQRHASGFSGCNRYMGTYTLKDGKLGFGPLAGTRMACATPGGQIEGEYLAALSHIDRSGVQMRDPQQLMLVLDDGSTLTFARRAK
ncbi:META domain-containing protein [Paraburkholderia kururiensis]|uniref:META domain-containing protein n=1 Tax=Paraburkholderia kururiensis TaxID=984307 RepID=UPI000F87ED57|nr:META domain-containing protein [Paraburkholderia kururiensis]